MLKVERLAYSVGGIEIFRDVSLELPQGGQLFIVGRSGAGKSSLLRCISGLARPSAGEVRIADQTVIDARRFWPWALRRRNLLGFVFQQVGLFSHMSVLRNVTLPLRRIKGLSKTAAEESARAWLKRLDIAELEGRLPGQISGGQAQRAAIARAVALEPRVILFDEPTSALDPETTDEFAEILQTLEDSGITVLVVSHDIQFVLKVARQVLVMENGGARLYRDRRELVREGPAFVRKVVEGLRGIYQDAE